MLLSDAQLQHFADKGWCVREGVFTHDECVALRAAAHFELDRLRAVAVAAGRGRDSPDADAQLWGEFDDDEATSSFGRVVVPTPLSMHADANQGGTATAAAAETTLFAAAAFHTQKMLPAMRQLLGAEPTFHDSTGGLDGAHQILCSPVEGSSNVAHEVSAASVPLAWSWCAACRHSTCVCAACSQAESSSLSRTRGGQSRQCACFSAIPMRCHCTAASGRSTALLPRRRRWAAAAVGSTSSRRG